MGYAMAKGEAGDADGVKAVTLLALRAVNVSDDTVIVSDFLQ